MVDDFLDGQSDEQLRGAAQKLAALELGAFEYANGLTEHAPGARYDFGVPPGLDDLRDHASRTAMLNAVPDFMPLPWLETLQRVAALPTLDPIEWLIAAVAPPTPSVRRWHPNFMRQLVAHTSTGSAPPAPSASIPHEGVSYHPRSL
ncbi:hypothetical protein [uncultured Sphingomonas sp.]|uniref:hypothetical protein n=1 Tax=uncultured Sphingomonas sp. TaxID=158754 RepID=UPI0025F3C73A|nr:hypothetical protein [uncultured Sphingomonas sp.]